MQEVQKGLLACPLHPPAPSLPRQALLSMGSTLSLRAKREQSPGRGVLMRLGMGGCNMAFFSLLATTASIPRVANPFPLAVHNKSKKVDSALFGEDSGET